MDIPYSDALVSSLTGIAGDGYGFEPDISKHFRYKKADKGSFLLREGELQSEIFFNAEGFFRYFYIDHEGSESVKHFSKSGEWTFSLSAFITHSPAKFFIQAVQDSHLLAVKADALRGLISGNPAWRQVYYTLVEKYYVIKEEREAAFLKNDAKGRYLNFLREYPELADKLKQHQTASYLGITPVTLSRIKKTLKA